MLVLSFGLGHEVQVLGLPLFSAVSCLFLSKLILRPNRARMSVKLLEILVLIKCNDHWRNCEHEDDDNNGDDYDFHLLT